MVPASKSPNLVPAVEGSERTFSVSEVLYTGAGVVSAIVSTGGAWVVGKVSGTMVVAAGVLEVSVSCSVSLGLSRRTAKIITTRTAKIRPRRIRSGGETEKPLAGWRRLLLALRLADVRLLEFLEPEDLPEGVRRPESLELEDLAAEGRLPERLPAFPPDERLRFDL